MEVVGGLWEGGGMVCEGGVRVVGRWMEDGCRVYAGISSVSSWSGTRRTPELHSTQLIGPGSTAL